MCVKHLRANYFNNHRVIQLMNVENCMQNCVPDEIMSIPEIFNMGAQFCIIQLQTEL